VIPTSFEALAFDASSAGFVLLEQVEGDADEEGEVLRRVALPFAAEVFAEAHIEHPMQFVFDAPALRPMPRT
jgi:hypothetical protein